VRHVLFVRKKRDPHGSVSTNSDLPDDARTNLIKSVARWNFEPHRLPDEEVVSCTMVIFEALFRIEGMQDFAGVSLSAYSRLRWQ